MGFKGYFMKGVEIVKLNRAAAEEVAKDDNAFGMAVLFVAIGGAASGIGGALASFGAAGAVILFMPVLHVIGSFVGVAVLFIIARLMGGTGGYRGYYSALGIGSLSIWAGVVPFLGGIVSLWNIPVTVIVTERVHNLSTGKAIFVVLIPFIVMLMLLLIIIAFFGMAAFWCMMGMCKTPGM